MIGHVLRKAFFQPKVVKPAHGHQVAEPLVGSFVQQEDVAVQAVAVGRRRAKEDGLLAEKGCASMFHAPIGKARNHDQVVLRERKGLLKVGGQILNSVGRDLLNLCSLFAGTFDLRLANIKPRQPRSIVNFLEWPGGESKKISADGPGLVEDRESGVATLKRGL